MKIEIKKQSFFGGVITIVILNELQVFKTSRKI